LGIFKNLSRNAKYDHKLTRITDTLHEDLLVCTFMTISVRILVRIRNVSEEFVKKIKIHILFPITFFYEILAFY